MLLAMHTTSKEYSVGSASSVYLAMEELHLFDQGTEQRAFPVQSKDPHHHPLRLSKYASSKLMPSQHAADLAPPVFTPPSTSSPRDPFVQLDSTSTASMSHLAPESHVFSHHAQRWPPEQTSTGSDTRSSSSPCQTPREVAIAGDSFRSLSLERHLQSGDTRQEENLQSFILQRFLPAAKTVAADHDCIMSATGKRPGATPASTTPRSSLSNSTPRSVSAHFKKSTLPTPIASKRRAWSHAMSSNDEGVNDHEAPKSCGFFCVGMKTAASRLQDMVQTSSHSMPANKSRVPIASSHGTSSDEEDAHQKPINLARQYAQYRRSVSMSSNVSLVSTSCDSISIHDMSKRHVASSKDDHALCRAGSATYSDSRPSLNLCIKCRSNGTVHQPSAELLREEIEDLHIERQLKLQSSRRCTDSCPEIILCSQSADRMQAFQGFSPNGHALCTGDRLTSSSQDPAIRSSFKESLVQHNLSEGTLGDQYCSEDDEPEFYDALSRFDSGSTTPRNASTQCENTPIKLQVASASLHRCTIGEHDLVQDNCTNVSKEEIVVFDADRKRPEIVPFWQQPELISKVSSSVLAPTASFKKCGSVFQYANDAFAQPSKDAYSNAFHMSNRDGRKKSSSSAVLGWPLGISRFCSGTGRNPPEVTHRHHEACVAMTEAKSTKTASAENMRRHDNNGTMSMNQTRTNKAYSEDRKMHCENCNRITGSSMDVTSPPVPPSPTTSWLGKALALKASTPSHLSVLQQEEKVMSAKKKLEFNSSADVKKGVRWEDLVKGSQIHSG